MVIGSSFFYPTHSPRPLPPHRAEEGANSLIWPRVQTKAVQVLWHAGGLRLGEGFCHVHQANLSQWNAEHGRKLCLELSIASPTPEGRLDVSLQLSGKRLPPKEPIFVSKA